MSDHKALVMRFIDGLQMGGDLKIAEECLAEDVVDHAAPPGAPTGRAAVLALFRSLHATFADIRTEVHDMICEGDRVVTRKTIVGRHHGDFMGIPATDRIVRIEVIDILRIENGRIAEHWAITDQLGLLAQLGVHPG